MEEIWKYNNRKINENETILHITIENENVDILQDFPNVKELHITNIGQIGFEILIKKYGQQFDFIYFFKCPLIRDFSLLSTLSNIKYLSFYWNNKASKLWDMSQNKNLKGIYFNDLSKIKDFNELNNAPILKELFITGGMWAKAKINTLKSIGNLEKLEYLGINNLEILDNDISPLCNLVSLKKLKIDERDFPIEYYAILSAKLTKTECDCFKGYVENSVYNDGKDIWIVGKRKPRFNKIKDEIKIQKYIREFEILKANYL